ncbi:MAG: hypothetical protein Q8R28_09095 [Dehalococcoidia bacterium]|nr:hypothetical protein [Dehalococcoidia bacterium]
MAILVVPGPAGTGASRRYLPERLTEAEIAVGVLVDTLPARPETQAGHYVDIMADLDTGEVWWAQVPLPVDELDLAREEGREEIRVEVREAAALDRIDGAARERLKEKGILGER